MVFAWRVVLNEKRIIITNVIIKGRKEKTPTTFFP